MAMAMAVVNGMSLDLAKFRQIQSEIDYKYRSKSIMD